jgi:hypothetical protein
MTKAKSGDGLSETAKSHIKECVLAELYGFRDFTGNKYTQKGIELEDDAIRVVGALSATNLKKHEGRVNNEWITGECDILTAEAIHDVKCPWSIGTHPFFDGEADEAVKKAGYDWQGRGYMMLYDRPKFHVHYVLLPTPHALHGFGDVSEMLVEAVEEIPLINRVKTVTIQRDLALEELIKTKVSLAQSYARELTKQLESI